MRLLDTTGYSTEKLIRLAFEHQLLSDYRMTPTCIELVSGDHTWSFDPEEARHFLHGLLRGFCAYTKQKTYSIESAPRSPAAAA